MQDINIDRCNLANEVINRFKKLQRYKIPTYIKGQRTKYYYTEIKRNWDGEPYEPYVLIQITQETEEADEDDENQILDVKDSCYPKTDRVTEPQAVKLKEILDLLIQREEQEQVEAEDLKIKLREFLSKLPLWQSGRVATLSNFTIQDYGDYLTVRRGNRELASWSEKKQTRSWLNHKVPKPYVWTLSNDQKVELLNELSAWTPQHTRAQWVQFIHETVLREWQQTRIQWFGSTGLLLPQIIAPVWVSAEQAADAEGYWFDRQLAFTQPVVEAQVHEYADSQHWWGWHPQGYSTQVLQLDMHGCLWKVHRFYSCD